MINARLAGGLIAEGKYGVLIVAVEVEQAERLVDVY